MFPAAFDYHAPRTLPDAISVLADLGADAKILAGGCSLIPLMKLRLAEPAHLVDLRHIDEVRGIRREDGRLVIGAMTREAEVESSPAIAEHAPLLAETSSVIADPLVRNMGTLGGNAAHADPANDHPAALLALDASIELAGPAGRREVPAEDFFVDIFTTAIGEGEVLTSIRVPTARPSTGSAYVKVERQVGDFAVVGVAVRLVLHDGAIEDAAIALTNVGPVALRARQAEDLLRGQGPDDRVLRRAGEAALAGIDPWDELRGSVAYKTHLVPIVVRRALERAVARAEGSRVGA
jgi:aerobic carbon-monoxide dehydrogenase medium subunit